LPDKSGRCPASSPCYDGGDAAASHRFPAPLNKAWN
jgi:hypothetical protein